MKLLFLILGLFLITSASNSIRTRVEGVFIRAYEQYSSILSSSRDIDSISDPITKEIYKELPSSHFGDSSALTRNKNWNQVLKKKVMEYKIHKGKFDSVIRTVGKYYSILFNLIGYAHITYYYIKKAELLTELTLVLSRVTKKKSIIDKDNYLPITLYIMLSLKDLLSNEIVPKAFRMQEPSSSNEESADRSVSPHEKPSLKTTPIPGLKLSLRTKALRSVIKVPTDSRLKESTDSSFDYESLCQISNNNGNQKRAACTDIETSSKRIRVAVPDYQHTSEAKQSLDPISAVDTSIFPSHYDLPSRSKDFPSCDSDTASVNDDHFFSNSNLSPNNELDVQIDFVDSKGPNYDPNLDYFFESNIDSDQSIDQYLNF